MNHTDLAAATPSFRERIAARRAHLAAAAALTLGALAPATAEAAIYTVASPSANNLNFDPLDGSTAPGSYAVTAENPLFLAASGGAMMLVHTDLLNSGNFDYFGARLEGFRSIGILEAGVTIDGTGTFHDATTYEFTTVPLSGDASTLHYLGFRYTNQGPGADETYYGWVEFTVSDFSYGTLTRFALGGNGQAIVTGQDAGAIPEPSSAALLVGALALGASCSRRRRR